MIKNTFFAIIAAITLFSCAQSKLLNKKTETIVENPGYYKQWFNEHKDENGEIPYGLNAKWFAHDKALFENAPREGNTVIASVENLATTDAHGGRTRSIMVSSLDSNRIFAGSVSGGLWRSDDGGGSWSAINDQAANLSVTCIVENPFNPKEIYYGTGEVRGASQPPGDGVYKSVDGGLTFNKLASTAISDMRFCNYMTHSTVDSSTVWLGTSQGLYVTKNNGQTWTKVIMPGGGSGSVSGIISFPDSSIMVSYIGSKIYKSPTGLQGSYTAIADSLFPKISLGRILIANCKKVPNVVYSFFTNNAFSGEADRGVFRSDDGGKTWTQPQKDTIRIGSAYQSYCQVLGVDANNPDNLMVGTVNGSYSTNGGKSWKKLPIGHADNHAYCQLNSKSFLIGCDGGIYKHNWDDIEANPEDFNNSYTCSQYYAGNYGATGKTAVGGTQDNGSWRYKNGVLKKVYGGDGAYSHISLQNPNFAYVSTQNGATYRVDNFSLSPNVKNISPPKIALDEGVDFINEHQINYADDKQLYYRTAKGIWRTVDKGSNWERINGNNIGNITAIGVTNEINPTVYAAGNGSFYRIDSAATKPEQSTFVNLKKKLPSTLQSSVWGNISFHPFDKTTMFVGLSALAASPRIWKGIHVDKDSSYWSDLSGNLPKNLGTYQVQVHPDKPDSVILAATAFGLYYTTDGGKNWMKETRIPNVPIFEMKLRASDKTLFLFTHGRGVWYVQLENLTNTIKTNDIVSSSWEIYPNPVQNKLSIKGNENISTVQIFDLNGKELLISRSNNEINTEILPSGAYFVKIFDQNGRFAIKKVIKE